MSEQIEQTEHVISQLLADGIITYESARVLICSLHYLNDNMESDKETIKEQFGTQFIELLQD